jgi:CBS domain containing-hemolysin-like protein
MALVVDETDCLTPLGVITLENVIEELIQEDIADETDRKRYTNMKKKGIEGAVNDLGTTVGWKKKGKNIREKSTRGWETDSSSTNSMDDSRDGLDSDLSSEASSDDLDAHFRHIIELQANKGHKQEPLSGLSLSSRSSLLSPRDRTETSTPFPPTLDLLL